MPPILKLRDVLEADLPVLYAHQLEPEGIAMAAFAARDRNAFMAHWAKLLPDPKILKKTILAGTEIAGQVASFDHEGRREVGYWLGKDFWGQGIATRALTEFLGLETTRPLFAGVAAHNLASLRVLEKCGFRRLDGHGEPGSDGIEVSLRLDG